MKSLIRNQLNTYKVNIYSDPSLNTTNQYTINHDTNILVISQIFHNYSIGKVHSLIIKPNSSVRILLVTRINFLEKPINKFRV